MQENSGKLPIQIIATLWVYEGQRALFIEYESYAIKIMANYGGKLLAATVIQESSSNNSPSEIHVLEFPSLMAFEKYRNDEELSGLGAMRAKCIKATEIAIGQPNELLLSV